MLFTHSTEGQPLLQYRSYGTWRKHPSLLRCEFIAHKEVSVITCSHSHCHMYSLLPFSACVLSSYTLHWGKGDSWQWEIICSIDHAVSVWLQRARRQRNNRQYAITMEQRWKQGLVMLNTCIDYCSVCRAVWIGGGPPAVCCYLFGEGLARDQLLTLASLVLEIREWIPRGVWCRLVLWLGGRERVENICERQNSVFGGIVKPLFHQFGEKRADYYPQAHASLNIYHVSDLGVRFLSCGSSPEAGNPTPWNRKPAMWLSSTALWTWLINYLVATTLYSFRKLPYIVTMTHPLALILKHLDGHDWVFINLLFKWRWKTHHKKVYLYQEKGKQIALRHLLFSNRQPIYLSLYPPLRQGLPVMAYWTATDVWWCVGWDVPHLCSVLLISRPYVKSTEKLGSLFVLDAL